MPKKREKPIPKWSERLAELRRSTGLTQRAFAEVMGISAGSVKRLEVGDLPLSAEMLERYAKHFGCFPEYITGEKDHRSRLEELLAGISEPEELRQDLAVALQAWIASRLPGDKLNRIDLSAVQKHVFDYLEDQIAEAEAE